MKFIALLPVRDEADIVAQCTEAALEWADELWVYDTGSVDETWDVLNSLAANERRIKLVGSEPVYFSEQLVRGYLFHKAREGLVTGDWFLRLDADEFHHVSPREFVETSVRRNEGVVYHQYYNFALTDGEVAAWESGDETLADRSKPIASRRRFYSVSDYSEPRMCRYRESMRWPSTVSFPINAGLVARERIPIRHYPHRDPAQLARRCRLRAAMMANKENRTKWPGVEYHYWSEQDWRTFVVSKDDKSLSRWGEGQNLPHIRNASHLTSGALRFAQATLHTLPVLPMLDRFRTPWPEFKRPQPIEPSKVEELRLALASLP